MSEDGSRQRASMVLDLDGTLVDSVYLHVRAWSQAFEEHGLSIPSWRIHRRVGMAGELLARVLLDEEGEETSSARNKELDDAHGRYYDELRRFVRPFDGARELLATLSDLDVRWAIATSSSPSEQGDILEQLGVGDDAIVVSDSDAGLSKPDPELFRAAIDRLGVDPADVIIVGDSPWDMLAARRAGGVSIGALTGGFSASELHDSGALRVYSGPRQLRIHLPEFGFG